MLKRRLAQMSLFTLSFVSNALAGGIINVPAQAPTIQAGIQMATPGDEVVIATGTYFENIDLLGKAITLRSTDPSDPLVVDATIIDGSSSGSVITCDDGEGPSTVIDGLTITNGLADQGGGLSCLGTNPTVSRCVFTANTADEGGGIYHDGPDAIVITDSTFSQNSAIFGGGFHSVATITDELNPIRFERCVFTQNDAGARQAALGTPFSRHTRIIDCQFFGNMTRIDGAVDSGIGTLMSGCHFEDNELVGSGGDGACFEIGQLSAPPDDPGLTTRIEDCTFTRNTSPAGTSVGRVNGKCEVTRCVFTENDTTGTFGPVLRLIAQGPSESAVTDCRFFDNTTTIAMFIDGINSNGRPLYRLDRCEFTGEPTSTDAMALRTEDANVDLTNCLITGFNATSNPLGIVYHLRSRVRLINSTVTDNAASLASGIFIGDGSATRLDVFNSIIWGNTSTAIVQTNESRAFAEHALIEGGFDGPGVIDADPQFMSSTGAGAGTPDYRLAPGSPAIDAGDNTLLPSGITADLDGNPRFTDDPDTPDTGVGTAPIIDMGAYEFQGVSNACAGDCDGNGTVNFNDLVAMLFNFGPGVGPCDADGSTDIDFNDLVEALFLFGPCP